ncbi:hypothetical protein WEH80_32510 [Actinomycetes bacterium KLBMP 9759]
MYADLTAAIAAQRTESYLDEAAAHRLATEARKARKAQRALAVVVATARRATARRAPACA